MNCIGKQLSAWCKLAVGAALALFVLVGVCNVTAYATVYTSDQYDEASEIDSPVVGDYWIDFEWDDDGTDLDWEDNGTELWVYVNGLSVYGNEGWESVYDYTFKWEKYNPQTGNNDVIEEAAGQSYLNLGYEPGVYRCAIVVDEADIIDATWTVTAAEYQDGQVLVDYISYNTNYCELSTIKKNGKFEIHYYAAKVSIDETGQVSFVEPDTITFQWRKEDEDGNMQDIAGATGRELELSYSEGDSGNYYYQCIVTVPGEQPRYYNFDVYVDPAKIAGNKLEAGKTDAQSVEEGYFYEIKPSKSDEYTVAIKEVTDEDGYRYSYSGTIYDADGYQIYSINDTDLLGYMKANETYYLKYYGPKTTLTISYSEEAQREVKEAEAAAAAEKTKADADKAVEQAKKDVAAAEDKVTAAEAKVTAAQQEAAAAKAASGANSPEAKAAKEAQAKAEADLKDAQQKLAAAEAARKKAEEKAAKLAPPAKVKIKKLTSGKKQIKVTFNKIKGVKGYELQYATNKKFSKNLKTVNVKASKKAYTIKNLTAKKKYFVRMRAYKSVDGGTVYGKWSKALNKKTK